MDGCGSNRSSMYSIRKIFPFHENHRQLLTESHCGMVETVQWPAIYGIG